MKRQHPSKVEGYREEGRTVAKQSTSVLCPGVASPTQGSGVQCTEVSISLSP